MCWRAVGQFDANVRLSDKLQFVARNDKLKKLIEHQTDPPPHFPVVVHFVTTAAESINYRTE